MKERLSTRHDSVDVHVALYIIPDEADGRVSSWNTDPFREINHACCPIVEKVSRSSSMSPSTVKFLDSA